MSEFHIGCFGVSKTIIEDIKSKYGEGANITNVYTFELKNKDVNTLKRKIKSKRFDHVVINGEGSLHTQNEEGKNIFLLIDELGDNLYKPSITILNASLYDLPEKWIDTLYRVDKIEVRDLVSKENLEKKGINSTFKPDRLFLYLSREKFLDHKFNKENENGEIILFDAVNKSHSSMLQELNLTGDKAKYGTVDLSPIYTLKNGYVDNVLDINAWLYFRFYLRTLVRTYRYRSIKGKKHITNPSKDLISDLVSQKDVITARYHIAVLCMFLGKEFSFISSNTKKIESLIEYFSMEFPGQVYSNKNNEIIKVRINLTRDEIFSFLKKYNYGV